MATSETSTVVTETQRSPLGAVSTVAALSQSLRSRILDGEFRPGHQMREVQLAVEYGVARQSVRAALHQLSQQGLLSHQPNRGVFVPEMTDQDIADIFVLRCAIEAEAVRMLTAERRVDDGVTAAYSRMVDLPSTASWGQVIQKDLDFHRALVASSSSRRLSDAYDALVQELQLSLIDLQQAKLPAGWLQDSHRAIIEAIRAGEEQSAVELVREHVSSSEKQLREIHANADADRAGS